MASNAPMPHYLTWEPKARTIREVASKSPNALFSLLQATFETDGLEIVMDSSAAPALRAIAGCSAIHKSEAEALLLAVEKCGEIVVRLNVR